MKGLILFFFADYFVAQPGSHACTTRVARLHDPGCTLTRPGLCNKRMRYKHMGVWEGNNLPQFGIKDQKKELLSILYDISF